MTRGPRCTCAACHAVGHTVNRCTLPVAADYWRAAAKKQRAKASDHLNSAHVADERGSTTDAAYHRRAALVALDDAHRSERKASAPGGKLEAVPKPRGKQ